jgi:RNA polymerase sigma-70 factor, ECF subfamily
MMTQTADIQLHNAGTDSASVSSGRVGAFVKASAARACGAIQTLRGPAAWTDSASDESLVARVAQGDRRAMQLLFVRHQQRVYRFVLRLVGNGATAEDIVSDVFIELWRQAASFERRARVSTWLLAIARYKALAAMRRRLDQPLDDALAIPDPATPADETLDASRRSMVLRRCLAQLSAAHREIVDLVYYHDKSIEEVSSILGVPAATVKTRMFYARKRLADLLKTSGVETVGF